MAKKKLDVRTLALVAVLTALVFAMSSIVSIPLGQSSRLHFGNIMCLLSGVLFGPFIGGISAGLGSMFYDFTNPAYLPEFWITFIMKFAMGFIAGAVSRRFGQKLPPALRYFVPALAGSVTYVLLYTAKSILWQHFVIGGVWQSAFVAGFYNGAVSLLNGVIAVVAVSLLAPVLATALRAAHLYPRTGTSG